MIDGKYDVEIGGQGYILSKDSYNQQFDQPFVTQVSQDDLDASDFSIWKAIQQTDFSAGFGYERFIQNNVFFTSKNIDTHYDEGEFRLSKSISTNLDTNATITEQTTTAVAYNGSMYILNGKYVYTSATGNAGSYSLEKNLGANGSDLVLYDNKLFAFMGANGYWVYDADTDTWTQESNGSAPGTGTNEAVTYGTVFTPGTISYLYATYTNRLLRGEWNEDDSKIDWTTVKEFNEDVNNYPGKPLVFNFNLYFWSRRGSSTLGSSQLFIHSGTTTVEVFPETGTVASRMTIYQNRLYYAVFGSEHLYIKIYDGANVTESKRIDGEYGGNTYDTFTYSDLTGSPTGSPTGSHTKYDAGITAYSDPVHWATFNERLMMTVRSSASANYLYENSDRFGGWIRRNDFDLSPLATYAIWNFAGDLYIGDDIGQIFRISSSYSTSGFFVTSTRDANVPMSDKLWREIELVVDRIPAGADINVYYDDDESGEYISLNMPTLTPSDKSVIIPLSNGSTNVVSKGLRIKVELTTTDTAVTPVIRNVIARYYPIPDAQWRWQMTLLTIDGLYLHDGVAETSSANELINELRQAKATKTLKTYKDTDYVSTTLAEDITYNATSFDLASVSGLPTKGELMIEDERIRYTGISGTTLTGVTRGIGGTIAKSHSSGVAVDNSYVVIVHDVTLVDHDNNPIVGREGLARVTLYQS